MLHSYQISLVILSLIISVVASFLALGTATRINRHPDSKWIWVLGSGVSMGLGVWLMHFVGMLSYNIPINISYNTTYTLISLMLAVLSSSLSFYLISVRKKLTLLINIVSAVIMGSGISGMHYVGIYAMQLSPTPVFTISLVIVSVLISFTASFLAIKFVFFASNRSRLITRESIMSSIIMGIAITGMHYIGMESMHVLSGTICTVPENAINQGSLAFIIVMLIMAVLIINAGILIIDLNIIEIASEKAHSLAETRNETLKIARRVTESLAEQYKISEEFNRKLFETVANSVIVMDRDGYIVRVNKAAEFSTGYAEVELTGREFWDVLIIDEEKDAFKQFIKEYLESKDLAVNIYHVLTKDKNTKMFSWSYTSLLDENNETDFIIATAEDITQNQEYENAMRWAEVAFETSEAIFVTDAEAKILRINSAFTDITGYSSDEVCSKSPSVLSSGRHDSEFYNEMWRHLSSSGCWNGEIWNKRKNGEIYPEWLRITAVYNEEKEVTNYVATFSDISNLKFAEEQIHFFSNFDSSTNLPNRKLFTELVQKELDISAIGKSKGAILYIELSQLDKLTDIQGINAVDVYIKSLSESIIAKFGSDLIIGHINNTDLAILLTELTDVNVASGSIEIAGFIIKSIKEGITVGEQKSFIHVNIGIIDYPRENELAEDLLQHATTAANRARKIQLDSYQFYSSYMQKVATESYALELALREALVNDELQLFLQPQINSDYQLIGAEALLRWSNNGVNIPPDKFIPLAEESELIIDVGDWVIKKALSYIKILEGMEIESVFKCIAVNVSAIQLVEKNFVQKLKSEIIAAQINPIRLKLEITESAVLKKPDVVMQAISELRNLGISIAMDDFGTGYSSLSYLQKLKLDQLKIDKSFITDLSINKTSQALAETIIIMAKNLGMEVIAEGVETKGEQELLYKYGCRQYQGFLYSRPIEFDAFLNYAVNPIELG